jgi:hypothetical protein
MSATPNDFVPEAGTRNWRIEYVRETSRGVTPSDPEWKIYSDHTQNWWDWEPEANREAIQPAGDVDPDFTKPGSETHEATIAYWLQEWFVDGSGNAQDAAADAMLVSSDNTVNNTHSIVSRMEVNQNGNDDAGYRVYHVGKGGVPTEVTIPFEVDNGSPVQPELNYQFEKMRTYIIHQPSSSTTLDVTNNGSTSVDVTIEDEGAATSETVTVGGSTTTTTVETFGDIDAVELSDDVDGDVVVTDGSGTTFTTIQGSDDRTAEGDLGVPALGSGSHSSAFGTEYVIFNDDDPPDWGGSELEAEWISGELNVSLEVEDNEVAGTSRRNIHITGRRATWSNTVAGPDASVVQVERFLSAANEDITWTADEGSITGPNAEYFSPGTSDFEAGSGKNERSVELQSQGVNIT